MAVRTKGGAGGEGIKSASRTLAILEYFALHHRAARVSDIAAELDIPVSSTWMLMKELTQLGYLQLEPETRRYAPTLRVMFLGAWLQERLIGRGLLLDLLYRVRERLRMTVLIGMQRNAEVNYILALRRQGSDDSLRAGAVRPVCHTGVGRALLLHKPEAEVRSIIRRSNAENSPPDRQINESRFLQYLETQRTLGWCESEGTLFRAVRVVAAPLPQLEGQPQLAIGIGGPERMVQLKRGRIIAELRMVCDELQSAPGVIG